MRYVVAFSRRSESYSSWPTAARVTSRAGPRVEEGPAQALVAAPASDPAPVITVVEEQGRDRPRGRSRTAE